MYIQRLLYQNLMVTAHQNSVTEKKRKRNPSTTLKKVIKSQEDKRGKEEKRPKKQIQNN